MIPISYPSRYETKNGSNLFDRDGTAHATSIFCNYCSINDLALYIGADHRREQDTVRNERILVAMASPSSFESFVIPYIGNHSLRLISKKPLIA